jgi:hypothetical protein
MIRFRYLAIFLVFAILPVLSQTPNKRLILKDGSYQITKRYEIVGDRVRYISSERGGEWEELPTSLVDWVATEKWARDHAPGTAEKSTGPVTPGSQAAAEIDKEEQQERAEAELRVPEVAPGLRLPDDDGVWALDTFRGTPELVHVEQNSGNLNHETTHNILRSTVNPLSGNKTQIQLDGVRSKVRIHVNDPVLYLNLDNPDNEQAPADALTVDTHGAGSAKSKKSQSPANSHYAIVRAQTAKNLRVIGSVNVSMLGKVSQSEDIVDTTTEILPGKHWMKLTPKQPLEIGEYALIEIISPKEVNLAVWDFRVDPTSQENLNARMPIQRQP